MFQKLRKTKYLFRKICWFLFWGLAVIILSIRIFWGYIPMMRFISHLLPYHDFYSNGFFSTRWLHTRTEAQYYSPRNPMDTPWCIFEPPVFPSLGKILDHPSYQDLAFDTPINTNKDHRFFKLALTQEEFYQSVFIVDSGKYKIEPLKIAVFEEEWWGWYRPRYPSGFVYFKTDSNPEDFFEQVDYSDREHWTVYLKTGIERGSIMTCFNNRYSMGEIAVIPVDNLYGQRLSKQHRFFAEQKIYVLFYMPENIQFTVKKEKNQIPFL